MKKVSLLFGIHMHQPVDNFDEAVEKAVKFCYEPFFEIMMQYPKFKFSLHCSGWLLDKIKTEYPKLFENMQTLTKAGSIEWLSGGYYEPVLSSIPPQDIQAQIFKLTAYIKKHFKTEPRGLWLTERVWESGIITDLQASKIAYTLVDDYHFVSNRYDAQKMNGYYTTENGGKEMQLFPIAKKLRYTLPFSEVEDAIQTILSFQKEHNSAAIIFDDAEKFGLWPDTHKWVYEQQWLEKFVPAVLANENIKTQHYSRYLKNNRSLGLAYLDNCSYSEMGEWSLNAADAKRFKELEKEALPYTLKGEMWKNFFIKYHESNYLHKRMLYLSAKQENFSKNTLDALYRLQTNDVFWHGIFGGFYLPSLRDNAYSYLLTIEKELTKKNKTVYELLDIDKDGYEELKVRTPNLSLLLSLKNGAQMQEFGSFDVFFNWQNTIMRREESYHQEIINAAPRNKMASPKEKIETIHNRTVAVDESLKSELIYDWHPKNSFIEHFSRTAFSLENFRNLTFNEVGDFANGAFELQNRQFKRNGGIYIKEEKYKSSLQKQYLIETSTIMLHSNFKTQFDEQIFFAQEFNLHFAHPSQVTFNAQKLNNGLSLQDIQELVIVDDFTQKTLRITTDKKCDFFAYILHTVSHSESGFEKIAQQISFIFTLPLQSQLQFQISIEVQNV